MKNMFFILTMLLSVVSFSQNGKPSTPKIAIKISLGETISVENHQVKFVEVLEDSRCPKYTTCVWAGRAKVLVEITEDGKKPFQKQLIFGQIKQGETKDLTLFTTEKKSVVGITLKPYPTSENSGSEKEYQLLIFVKKNKK